MAFENSHTQITRILVTLTILQHQWQKFLRTRPTISVTLENSRTEISRILVTYSKDLAALIEGTPENLANHICGL